MTSHVDAQAYFYYVVAVQYHYQVKGVRYHGSRISFDSPVSSVTYNTLAGAKAAVRFYSQGKHVRVYYKPGSPSDSALRTGFSKTPEEELILAGLLIGFGLYSGWTERRPDTSLT